nr:isonitrile hydratase [Quercus suber]
MGSLSRNLADLPDAFYAPDEKSQALDIVCHWVNERGAPAQLTAGMRILPTETFDTCPPLDIVLMGANQMDYEPSASEIAFIRKSFETCSAFIAVCGGFRSLLLAGLLEGKTATAPRFLLDSLRQSSPGTKWVYKRWCRDGKLWTTGQLVNGLDAMRAFAEFTWGEQNGLVKNLLINGAWPSRDIDFIEHLG